MCRRLPLVVTGGLLLVALMAPAVAHAAQGAPTTSVELTPGQQPWSKYGGSQTATKPAPRTTPTPAPKSIAPSGTAPYPMDFTLPSLGKSGCMVCHGDRNLIRIKGNEYISFYIPEYVITNSAHGPGPKTGPAGVLCTGCHLDFASTTPHKNNENWQRTAKSACRACHTLEDEAFGKGAHAVSTKPGQVDAKADQKPMCGDCHGSHEIQPLDAAGKAALHQNGWQVCGRCHRDTWASYNDYYHGAAYKRGAPDAPACWDCHGAHDILPSKDRNSPTNAVNLAETCSGRLAGRKCHDGVNDQFLQYGRMVHQKQQLMAQNPVYGFIRKVQTGISDALSNIADAVRSWFV